MNLDSLLNYINPIILGICLMVGYVIKTAFTKIANLFIPLTALCMGAVLSMLIHMHSGITADRILGGMISGLASTGLYEMLKNLLTCGGKLDE